MTSFGFKKMHIILKLDYGSKHGPIDYTIGRVYVITPFSNLITHAHTPQLLIVFACLKEIGLLFPNFMNHSALKGEHDWHDVRI